MSFKTVKNLEAVSSSYTGPAEKTVSGIARIAAIPVLAIIDLLAVASSLLLAFCLRENILQTMFPTFFKEALLEETFTNIWWLPLVVISCLFYENLYQKRLPYWQEVEKIFKAITLALVFTIVLLFISRATYETSRSLIILLWLLLAVTLPLARYYGKLFLTRVGIWRRPVLIVGAGKTACLIAEALQREKTTGYQVAGIINDRGGAAETINSETACSIPILGSLDQAERIIKTSCARDLFLAMPSIPANQTVEITNRLQPLVANVIVVPDLFGLSLSGIEAQHFFEEQVLMLHIKNKLKPLLNRAVKRIFDLLLGTILLLMITPLFLIITLAIKLDSRGPVFFNSRRIGQNGKLFLCHKFRTMRNNADQILESHLSSCTKAKADWEEYRKLINGDPRLTRVGKLLRRFSLDELPQLINIVCGDMSIVGPRPYLPDEKELMGEFYDDITVAKPGLTGLWQVSGRNLIDFEGRMKLGAWYVKNWSLWLDLVIILKTFRVVIKGEGAY